MYKNITTIILPLMYKNITTMGAEPGSVAEWLLVFELLI